MIDYLTQAFQAADRLPQHEQAELAGRIFAEILERDSADVATSNGDAAEEHRVRDTLLVRLSGIAAEVATFDEVSAVRGVFSAIGATTAPRLDDTLRPHCVRVPAYHGAGPRGIEIPFDPLRAFHARFRLGNGVIV